MITRRRKENNLDTPESMFEPPVAEVFADHDGEGNAPQEDRYDTLAKQLADLQTRLSESEKTNMALLSTPQWRSQVTDQAPQDVKPESVALPDPALDPDGYDAALARRNQIRDENARRRQEFDNQRQSSLKEKVDDLWNAFTDQYPDMSEDKEKIDFVASQVAKEAQRRGVDVERYMFVTRDKYLSDVADKYVKVFGDPADNEGDDDFEDTPRSRRASTSSAPRTRSNRRDRSEDDNVGRTGGIFGGAESGGRPSRGRDEESGPSMIDDIQALQRKTGFF